MNESVFTVINAEYEHKRREAERAAAEAKNRAYSEIPALYDLDAQMSKTASEYALRIIEGEDVEDEMREKLHLIRVRKDELLEKNGLSEQSFEPRYSCPLCKDTGIADGKYCSCYKKRIVEENFRTSNIGQTLDGQSFESFDLGFYSDEETDKYPLTPRENAKRNYNVCKAFADGFENVRKSLLLIGGTGLGKTFLSTCIAKQLLANGKSVIYISAVDFFKRIEKSRFDQNDGDVRLFETCDLLIIDDLGTEAPSVYTTAVFSDILDKRMRCGRKMILSSNCRFKDFEKLYGERVFSRLAGLFECLIFYGKDIRVQKFLKGENN